MMMRHHDQTVVSVALPRIVEEEEEVEGEELEEGAEVPTTSEAPAEDDGGGDEKIGPSPERRSIHRLHPPLALVVGLGNPGSRYEQTRHNAGFWFVDALADRAGATFRPNARFLGDVCELTVGDQRLRLLKPTTFMNRSGQAVAALARFYRHSVEEILVVHDEIDLPVGSVRLKRGGGHGGHNGLRDLVAHLGSSDFRARAHRSGSSR